MDPDLLDAYSHLDDWMLGIDRFTEEQRRKRIAGDHLAEPLKFITKVLDQRATNVKKPKPIE